MAETNKNYDTYTTTELIARIKELESALKDADLKIKVSNDLLVEMSKKNNDSEQLRHKERQAHLARIAALEDPNDRFSDRLSWMGKVIFIIRRVGRPLRAIEIYDELSAMDSDINSKSDPNVFLSVVLAKAVREKRLSLHKVVGTRGGYYALEEWLDHNGNLISDFKEQLL